MELRLKLIQDTLAFISQNGYETNQTKFLKSTALFLAELFDINYVLIDKYSHKKPNIAETVVFYGKGSFKENLGYKLANTPCGTIINKKLCSYPINVKAIFSKDDFLTKKSIESYIGIPLWSSKKEPIGLIALMDNKSKSENEVDNIELVLQIISLSVEKRLEEILYKETIDLNIKELKIVKENAEDNTEKFKKLSNLTFEGILIHDKGVAIDCNTSFIKMFGYTHKDLIGKDITKVIYPKEHQNTILKNRINNYTIPFEIEGIRRNGTVFPVEIEARNIVLKNDKVFRVTAFRDLTDRKKADEDLRKSEKKYRFLFENNPQPMWIYDLETLAFLEVNNAAIQHYGYSREEFLSMTLKDIRPKEELDAFLKDIEMAKRVGYNPSSDWLHIKKSGEIINVNIVSHKVIFNTREARHILVNDITASKKAEQELLNATIEIEKSERKFREIFEKSGDAVLIVKNAVFVDCNQATIDLLGYKGKEDVLNLCPSELSPKIQPDGLNSKEKAEAILKIALEKGSHRFEWWSNKSNGDIFPVEVQLTIIENEPDNIVIHCICRDITESKNAENKLLKAYETIKERENFVNKIIETANEGFWLIDQNAITIKVNAEMCKILGRQNIEVKEKSIYNFVDEKNSEIFKKQLEGRKKGEASVYEIELLNTNGKNVPCLFKTSPIFNNKNEMVGSFALVSDITNLKETFYKVENQNLILKQLSNELSEKNLLLSETKDRFTNLFEQNPVPLWEQDFSNVIEILNDKKTETDDLKTYLDENPDFVSTCISNIRILNANKAALELFGLKSTNELKTHFDRTNTKRAVEVLKNELVSIGLGKKVFSDETEFIGKDNTIISAFIKSVIIDNLGTSIASVRDITEAKNAENKLKETQFKLLESQKIAKIGSYELDFSTGLWTSSPALDEIFGIDEQYNRNSQVWKDLVHPEDKEMMEEYFIKNIKKSIKINNGSIQNEHLIIRSKEYRIVRKSDKQIRWVLGLGKIEFNNDGTPKRLIGTTQDISEKRQNLLDLISAKEKAEESEYNLKNRIKELKGITALKQLIEKNEDTITIYKKLVKAIIPNSLQYTNKVYCELEINNNIYSNNKNYKIPKGKNYLSGKIWINKKQIGNLKVAYTEDLPFIANYERNLIETFCANLSAFLYRQDLLEKLIKAKEKAEESNTLKTEFIQNLSHEIRTPMNGILGFSELLSNHDLSEEKREKFIDIIKNSTHQLLRVIDDLMEISILESKQVKVEEQSVCINKLLDELHTVFNIKATERNTILILKDKLSDQESTMLTDKNKLTKVISNLLENALKFTTEGTVELGYKLNKDCEPAQLEIYVKDNGIGIESEKQLLIFERFSQAEKSLSKKVGGLGLGLSIAKENTELLGGKISVVSELGKGATFFISIPYKPLNLASKIETEEKEATETNKKHTILVAEDEELNFMVIEMLLKNKIKLPCTVIHAENGLEAVEICKNNLDIELVLMDIKMPKMDGHEATRNIKKLRPKLPIVAQTAYSSPEEKEKAFLSGCDDFMSKPLSKESLDCMLSRYLKEFKGNS
ncbi:MAG TPA: PAS domain S-box protein [Lutibacter sp.]